MTHSVVFAPEAEGDLLRLYDYIAGQSSPDRALTYAERITAACRGLATFPQRGTRRDDIRPGLRVMGVAGRVTVAFHVMPNIVTIVRILYGGRDLGLAFDDGSSGPIEI